MKLANTGHRLKLKSSSGNGWSEKKAVTSILSINPIWVLAIFVTVCVMASPLPYACQRHDIRRGIFEKALRRELLNCRNPDHGPVFFFLEEIEGTVSL